MSLGSRGKQVCQHMVKHLQKARSSILAINQGQHVATPWQHSCLGQSCTIVLSRVHAGQHLTASSKLAVALNTPNEDMCICSHTYVLHPGWLARLQQHSWRPMCRCMAPACLWQ